MKRLVRLLGAILLVMVVIPAGMAGRTSPVRADTITPDTSGQTDGGTQVPPGVTGTEPQQQASQQVFFYKDGKLTPVDRQVTGGAQVAGFTISELLKGPTDEEKAQGYSTQIPDGVKMLYYTESNDGKTFGTDLSTDLEAVQGDPVRAREALDQVVKTAQAVSGAETVNITIGGEDAWQVLGVSHSASSSSSNLWWIILVAVLGTMTLLGTSLMLLAMRRGAHAEAASQEASAKPANSKTSSTKPIQSTARKGIKVSRAPAKKRRFPFPRKDSKR